ncbi:MAG: TetR/AcrR family transcriptional regulator [Jatrophihabitans sp.]|nr:MAG: TetR/AcrR family transcriptional regulator [Jatrophihabitans sp.]
MARSQRVAPPVDTPAPDARTGPRGPGASPRPLRADARRNYERLLAAAHDEFTERGAGASLEEVARRAGVGVGTLYRHFPTRQRLLEAVYVGEVERLCRSAEDFAGADPWTALTGWLHRFVDYLATKRALVEEMMASMTKDAPVFRTCHDAIFSAGEPLLERAQQAGVVRPDIRLQDVVDLIGGITLMRNASPEQMSRVLAVAVDGLRYGMGPAPA